MRYTVSPVMAGDATLTAVSGDASASVPVDVADDNLWPDDIPLMEKEGITAERLEDGSYRLYGSSQKWNAWQAKKDLPAGAYRLTTSVSGNGVSASVMNSNSTETFAVLNGRFVLDEAQSVVCRIYNSTLGDVDGTVRPKLVREDS